MKTQAPGLISVLNMQLSKLWERDRAGSLKPTLRTLGNPVIINRVSGNWDWL